MSESLVARMEDALQDLPPDRHSYFQLKHFVIGKEPTVQGKMWQCLKEINSRKSQIEALQREIEDSKDRLELIDIQRGEDTLKEYPRTKEPDLVGELAHRKAAVHRRRLARQQDAITDTLGQLEEKLKYTREESWFFLQTLADLRALAQVRALDDLEAQKEYWGERLANDVHLKLILRQPLDVELVKTVLSLHDDAPIKLQVCSLLTSSREALETAPTK